MFIEGQTHFGSSRGAKTSFAPNAHKKKTYHIRDVLYVKQPNPKQNLDRVRGEL